jgi:hypothetical protein
MNGTGGTNGTGPGPVPTGPISTKDAATYFGITERAVRKRIHAGTLMGEQIAGQWVVYPHAVRQGRPSRNPALDRRTEEQRPWTPEPLPEPSGAAAVMDRLVAPLVAQIAPLVAQIAAQGAQIGDLREELGRERTLREMAERELATIRSTGTPAPATPYPENPRFRERPQPRSLLGQIAAYAVKRFG